MSELPPKKEADSKSDKEGRVRKFLLERIENFLAKSDEPGPVLSSEEEFALSKQAGHDPEALKAWHKHKSETKYRRNALSVPLMAAEAFLSSDESRNVPGNIRTELSERMDSLRDHVIAVGAKPFTKEDVQEVVDFANDLKKYI